MLEDIKTMSYTSSLVVCLIQIPDSLLSTILPYNAHLIQYHLHCFVVGTPFKFHYWLAQCGVYLAVMFIEKLIVGPLILFDFWNKV